MLIICPLKKYRPKNANTVEVCVCCMEIFANAVSYSLFRISVSIQYLLGAASIN